MAKRNEEEANAQDNIWNYVFGFADMAVIRCAIDLDIPDILENHVSDSPMTLSDLSSAVGCPPSTLHRIMRYLVNRRIFCEEPIEIDGSKSKGYVPTPISRLLMRNHNKSMASFIRLQSSPFMLAPWLGLSKSVLTDCKSHAFEVANGKDVWSYAEANADRIKMINDAMACDARLTVPAIIRGCPEVFQGLESVVDVGGGNGTTLNLLVEAFPWIRGINFDLPHVVSVAKECVGVEHVGGDMFKMIPKADAIFMKWTLHDWGDEDCIKILKNCKDALPKGKGKVIIVEALLKKDGVGVEEAEEKVKEEDDLEYVRLMLDMVMMAHTETGKERTQKQWEDVLNKAGFSRYTVHCIPAVQSVIVVYA
ncbi:acetylserotonin O-methyltransferase-like [Impatiens glandulifera]|uniref:acetylserotonin O-methyltransferase-like n=1 Tax=Impatiens glandulifera TaxID=253017 RepID=UPI001FB0CE0F|nr:acetylserotonin O-methyltransferase-like [Impatiens glandulifera]